MDSSEEALVEARRAKAERCREREQNPFANDVDTSDRSLVHALRGEYASALVDEKEQRYDADKVAALSEGKRYHLLGRIVSRRGFGKASFLRLRDVSGEIQLFAKQDVMGPAFAALEDMDIADHVEVRGRAMVTKTGELSLELSELRLLTKALLPLPDKWHGLTNVDLRYRQRYVDFVANPEAALVMRARSIIVQGVRDFLDGRGYLEVETPTLHTLIGGAAARPFKTHHNTLDMELFMRIAPELYLKRLLVGGFERVYEIGRCYRNEGLSTRHNPEFTMLEAYQAYANYETLMNMTEEMFRHVDGSLRQRFDALGLAADYTRWVAERPFTLDQPFQRLPMAEGIQRALEKAGLPLDLVERLESLAVASTPGAPRNPEADALVQSLRSKSERAQKIDWPNLRRALGHCGSQGERVFIAYEYLVEPFLPDDYRTADDSKSIPVFIVDYPAEVSPLARKKDKNPALVDRFELFVHGKELGNAFSELNDPDDQAARFRHQVELKAKGNEETMDYDEDYIVALQHGMPPAAGLGIGIDRLVMALAGQPSNRDVIAFPLLRPEG
ncbi:MAG TPA: lysine--tRNA ligase [Polyangiaceae bacterium]|nr:lysine--tRNA ligase [Polyangiaceae bacterium]